MCGRFVRISPVPVIARRFEAEASADVEPSYNIAPGQDAIIVANTDAKKLFSCRWGFLPSWAKDPSMGTRMINARSETASVKPAFRHALTNHRCLIVADGFFEWELRVGKKYPFYIHLAKKELFGFAGLYNLWESSEGDSILTCTILTTQANNLIQPIHDRMPVIMPKDKEDYWLDPTNKDKERLVHLLAPYPSEQMELYPVSPRMNRPMFDTAENIKPL